MSPPIACALSSIINKLNFSSNFHYSFHVLLIAHINEQIRNGFFFGVIDLRKLSTSIQKSLHQLQQTLAFKRSQATTSVVAISK